SIQVIHSTAFKLRTCPLAYFIGGPVVHLEAATAPSHFNTCPTHDHLMAIDTLMGITDNEQVVLCGLYSRPNQFESGVADVLCLIHNHAADSQRRLLDFQQLASFAECLFRFLQICRLQLGTV